MNPFRAGIFKVRGPELLRMGIASFALTVLACGREAPDADPARVAQEFVMRMQRVHGDPKSARAAYELLWGEAKRNLAERAIRASAVSGRKVGPEEMIAPSRFAMRFEPKHYSADVQGDWAQVTMTGDTPDNQHDVVKCVREDGAWRVVLELPPPPTIQRRSDSAQ